MSKFKVGDRIIFTGGERKEYSFQHNLLYYQHIGMTGVVTTTPPDYNSTTIHVKWDKVNKELNSRSIIRLYETSVELLENDNL